MDLEDNGFEGIEKIDVFFDYEDGKKKKDSFKIFDKYQIYDVIDEAEASKTKDDHAIATSNTTASRKQRLLHQRYPKR